MKNFAVPSFRLGDASLEIRLIYSLFLLFILGGLSTIWFLQFQRIGLSYDRVIAYYLGGEVGGQMFFPKNLNALLEETHFHAFTMSVVFLILGHLFLATSLSRGAKFFFILITFFSHVFDMAGSWLTRLVSPLFAYLLIAAWLGLWIGYAAMIFLPLWEMWLPRPSQQQ
jgi:hypothetical protein